MTRGARLRLIVGYLLSAVDHGRYPCKTPRDGVYASDAGLGGSDGRRQVETMVGHKTRGFRQPAGTTRARTRRVDWANKRSAGRVIRPDGDGVADTSTGTRTAHEASRPGRATTKPHGVFCFSRNKYGQS